MKTDPDSPARLCRHCKSTDTASFLDLGYAPPSNAYLSAERLSAPEVTYPLRLFVCRDCRLVQTEDYAQADELFESDYAYFSSTSRSWLEHAKRYCDMISQRFSLSADSHVLELASNDGYLLKNFVQAGVPCLGIEPTHHAAQAARAQGIEVQEIFFGHDVAAGVPASDLIIGNNVFAHVPDINDFTSGMARALKPSGVITLEFPHLLNMVRYNQFDTVYHEHFSYLSLLAVERIFARAGLRVFDVEKLPTHGGSLRIYGCHEASSHVEHDAVSDSRREEADAGLSDDAFYAGFQTAAETVKNAFLGFLLAAQSEGKSVAGYGAAAKGNTLMNFAGIRPDLVKFVCDAAPAKIGKYLPGSHIPIHAPDVLEVSVPDYLVIFPWNIADEIAVQLAWLKDKGTRFFAAVPEMREL